MSIGGNGFDPLSGDVGSKDYCQASGLVKVVIFYLAPVILFLYSLYTMYQFAEMLLPLNVFWDEDAEAARRASVELVVVKEEDLTTALWTPSQCVMLQEVVESGGSLQ